MKIKLGAGLLLLMLSFVSFSCQENDLEDIQIQDEKSSEFGVVAADIFL